MCRMFKVHYLMPSAQQDSAFYAIGKQHPVLSAVYGDWEIYLCGDLKAFYTGTDKEEHTIRLGTDLLLCGIKSDNDLRMAEEYGLLWFENNPWFEAHNARTGKVLDTVFFTIADAERYLKDGCNAQV